MCLSAESLFLDDGLTSRFNLGVEAYRNKDACKEFVRFIAGVIRQDILAKVKSSPAFAIAVDESNDIGNIEEMVIYVWYVREGRPATRFLGLVPLETADSSSIAQAIVDKVRAWDLSPETFFAFGSDGCSVMTGADNGVAIRLRIGDLCMNPCMLSFHCMAHKLQLSAKGAGKDIPFFSTFESTLHSLASYFNRSAKRGHRFASIQKALGFEGTTVVLSDVVTRWLSKGDSVESIYKLLPALEEEFRLQASGCAVASVLHKEVTSFTFLATLAFHKDFFSKLNILSVSLQKDTVDYDYAMGLVESTKRGLQTLYIAPATPGGVTLKALLKMNSEKSDSFLFKHPQGEYRVQYVDADYTVVVQHIKLFAEALFAEFEDRFPPRDIIAAFGIFTPTNFPTDDNLVSDYGDGELELLMNHFSKAPESFNTEVTLEQWEALKSDISNRIAGAQEAQAAAD
ncbi:hypothetical protein CYMTET_40904 [Cymbomonas tetramitiformis]|uniref:DUF4371 domain-containing protein n=1 Tax=Cymbomonas tetramitiformis TaxID=36881 RepID=A0AAE0C8G1_9CHLO|nr:hypothetical protein CYMTET_40904 [Cymbomonas tetramitiformis]